MKSHWTIISGLGCSLVAILAVAAWAKEEKVSIDKVPAAVKTTIQAEGGKVEDIAREEENGKVIYEADVVKDGKEIELRIAEDGKLVSRKIEGDAKDEEKEEKEGNEDEKETEEHSEAKACVEGAKNLAQAKVTMIQALEIATKEGKGAKPVKADLEMEEGKLMYDIELLDGEKGPEMEIDAITGKVLKIETEEEQGKEDADDDDKDSKEEQTEARAKAAIVKAMPQTKVTLAEAVEAAIAQGPSGKAFKAILKPEKDKPLYEIMVVAGDKCTEVVIDGITRKVVETEEKGGKPERDSAKAGEFRDTFNVDKANLVATGKNPYFSLEPGTKNVFKEGNLVLTITVLDETKVVDGVTTRVIEEREEEDGQPEEISRNFFAIDKTTGDVYYFGEEVDEYKDGKIASHGGAWLSGVKGAKFGLLMPAKPKLGDKFYQEIAPKVAMDRAEIVALDEELKTPAGTFKCVHVKETSPLEKGASHKWYAEGVGLVKDDKAVLVEPAKAKK